MPHRPHAPASAACRSRLAAVFDGTGTIQDLFPGVTATKTNSPFPGVVPVPIGTTPLASQPTVIALDHLEPAQMSNADYEVVSNLSAELSKQAALANFDISSPAGTTSRSCARLSPITSSWPSPMVRMTAAPRALRPCCRATMPGCASSPPMPTVCCRLKHRGTGRAPLRSSTACCGRSAARLPSATRRIG